MAPRFVNELLERLGVYVEKLRRVSAETGKVVDGYRPLVLADVKYRQKKGPNGWVYDGDKLDMEVVGVNNPEVDPAWALERYPWHDLLVAGALSVSAKKIRDAYPADSKEVDRHLLPPSERLKIDLKPKSEDEAMEFLKGLRTHYPVDPTSKQF